MLQHFLSFDKLIGTKLIKILYYVGLVGIIIAGLGSLFAGFRLTGDWRYIRGYNRDVSRSLVLEVHLRAIYALLPYERRSSRY